MRKIVSEKTLELNIVGEILNVVRAFQGCERAFWMGMKQDQEARTGIDDLLRNVPGGYHLALQFKAPRPSPRDQMPYRFTINDVQHANLSRLAARRQNGVLYVFPNYNTFSRMNRDGPPFVDTWGMRVADLSRLPRAANLKGTHTVYLWGNQYVDAPGLAIVRSEPISVQLQQIKALLVHTLEAPVHVGSNVFPFREVLVSTEEMKEWLTKDVLGHTLGERRKVGQLLRGFSSIVVSA